jgi:site-specific DNA-methyltransferase (adenine-specific)
MPPRNITTNTLFYGDNLDILREYIADESIDLVYLDPPFNSSRNYNVLFRDESGQDSEAQITAFKDTWHWGQDAEATYHQLVTNAPADVAQLIGAMRQFVGENQMMAYLVMMAARLVELHRVLKPTGSLYLHCDPTASHYLKIILDTIFRPRNFRSEIIWKRSAAHGGASSYNNIHDTILYYSRAEHPIWNNPRVRHDESYIKSHYSNIDENGQRYQLVSAHGAGDGPPRRFGDRIIAPPTGRHWMSQEHIDQMMAQDRIIFTSSGMPRYKRYLSETDGTPLGTVWDDIFPVNSQATERLGYPTQKPLALLERIISASSNPGDTVLDPFCGCGTTIAAAQKLKRTWIGIDITSLSIALQKTRLKDMFGDIQYSVIGEPTDLTSARALAQEKDGRYQFQWWALSLITARPLGAEAGNKTGKKGADKGIDGVITFIDDSTHKPKQILVQVKSGHVARGDIGQLRGTIERDRAAIGIFITLEEPSQPMITEAISAGYYSSPGWGRDYPKIQILSIADLLSGKTIQMPPTEAGTFKQAPRVQQSPGEQHPLDL